MTTETTLPTTTASTPTTATERFDVVVIGGGQAGLAAGYHLARRGLRFVILDAGDRVGHAWRDRWDTPAGLHAGLLRRDCRVCRSRRRGTRSRRRTPSPTTSRHTRPRFQLPIRTGHRVDELTRADDGRGGYVVRVGDRRFEADQVVVATGAYDEPRIPAFAARARSGHPPVPLARLPEPESAPGRRRPRRRREQLRRGDRARRRGSPSDVAGGPGRRRVPDRHRRAPRAAHRPASSSSRPSTS